MYARFVALGDSTTEGVGDEPYRDGTPSGWADRLAVRMARAWPGLRYANLAVRGTVTRQVRTHQVGPACALEPDLASVLVGMNDLIRPRFDGGTVAADIDAVAARLRDAGADVLLMTFPDLSSVSPVGRLLRGRVDDLSDRIREIASRRGALLLDAAAVPAAGDPRVWADDRLHLNPEGHLLLADAMADLVGVPGADDRWRHPLPPPPARRIAERALGEAAWFGTHVGPWLGRRLSGRSSGDGRVAKRPHLTSVET
ncbi:lysophospholipase L1-like esterase [Mumia flava]|uniref:Lysophospholipase L1-like esterase n=1 Tax=Mumia flava TaxID=1348852 RepID=A0A0B2B6F5_9ACTN|nr:SGNH/GDSL hydrolase family protein [Mumia flava]PJJ57633.1 lysophospholipase L1-like esterase [Mumia flava]